MAKKHLDDILFIIGAALITLGVGLISFPAGVITAGIFCLIGSALYGRFMAVSTETVQREVE